MGGSTEYSDAGALRGQRRGFSASARRRMRGGERAPKRRLFRHCARTLGLLAFIGAGACDCTDDGLTKLTRLVVVDVERLSFADAYVGGSRTLDVKITNAGTAPVSLGSPDLDTAAFALVGSTPDVLNAGASIELDVLFAPNAVGDVAATLRIDTDATNVKRVTVELDGTGTAPLDCDDANDCTNESFDADAGECVRSNRIGLCDDGTQCTRSDRCDEGTCVGDAITCVDDVECTIDACDRVQGCVFLPQHDECMDDDPCSLDICDPNGGCANPPAPDGTSCGPAVICESLHVCIVQQCTEIAIPEGTPCNDSDVCTTGDVCTNSECTGVVSQEPPALIAESVRLMHPARAVLAQNRVVAVDQTLKVLTLDGASAPVRNPLVHSAFALATDGTLAVTARQRPQVEGAPAIPFIDFAIVDPLDPVAVLQAAAEGDALVQLIASQGHAYACVNGGALLEAVDLATGATTAIGAAEDFCTARFGPLAVDGGLALAPDNVAAQQSTQLRLYELDPAAVPVLHAIDRPSALTGTTNAAFLQGGLGAVVVSSSTRVGLVDARDLGDIRTATMDLPVGARAIGLRAPYFYFDDPGGLGRFDIDAIDSPVLDTWRADLSFSGGLVLSGGTLDGIDGAHALYRPRQLQQIFVVDIVASGAPVPLPGQGSFGSVVAADAGRIFTANPLGASMITAPFADYDRSPAELALIVPAVLDASELVGLFSPLLVSSEPFLQIETGPLDVTTIQRGDRRRSLDFILDPQATVGRVTFSAEGNVTNVFAGPTVAFPEQVSTLFAPAASSCIGAALGVRDDVDCVFPGCLAELFVFSVCNDAIDVVPLSNTQLSVLHQNELPFVGSTAHGNDLISFVGTEAAVLVDVADPLAPSVITAEVPELLGATFASAGADVTAWLVLVMPFEAPAHAILFDTSTGLAVRRAEWDLSPGGAPDIRRRVLAVSWPRAFVSEWTASAEPYMGHRVDIYDLEAVTPAVTDSIEIAGEPTGLSVQDESLVVVRSDGVSVISPPCGP